MRQYKLTQEQMEQGFRLEKIFDKYALYDKNNNHWFLDKFTIEQSIKASKSLVDCFGCENCKNCNNCWHCHRYHYSSPNRDINCFCILCFFVIKEN